VGSEGQDGPREHHFMQVLCETQVRSHIAPVWAASFAMRWLWRGDAPTGPTVSEVCCGDPARILAVPPG